MTEKKALYLTTEKEIQADVVNALRNAGWFVVVTSQDRRTRRQLSGLPDLLAFRKNHTLLIECKAADGALRGSQIDFQIEINEHVGPNLRHLVVYDVEQVASFA